MIVKSDSEKILESLESIMSEIKILRRETKTISVRQDEMIIDFIELQLYVKTTMKSILTRVDLFHNDGNSSLSNANNINSAPTRREPITAWWKKYYRENMMKLENIDNLENTELGKIGITAEIIDYVIKNKRNNKKTKKDKLEMEGSHIWRELSSRIKENSDGKWGDVREKIIDYRENYQIKLKKQNSIPLTLDEIIPVQDDKEEEEMKHTDIEDPDTSIDVKDF